MISELLKPKYKAIAKGVSRNNSLYLDLHSEVIILILEKKYDLSEIRNMDSFFATLTWLTWNSNKFRKKYFTNNIPIEFEEEFDLIDENIEVTFNSIIDAVGDDYNNKFDYYQKNLLRLYVQLGDCRKIANQTGIPYRTVANDIKHIKDKLKVKHNEENSN